MHEEKHLQDYLLPKYDDTEFQFSTSLQLVQLDFRFSLFYLFVHNSFLFLVNSCDPLGGRNVWQTLFPRSTLKSDTVLDQNPVKQEANGSIAILAARMDATSLFDGLVPSSVGAVTGIATLISTAELLHRMFPHPPEKSGE